jgi:hypothetical protein
MTDERTKPTGYELLPVPTNDVPRDPGSESTWSHQGDEALDQVMTAEMRHLDVDERPLCVEAPRTSRRFPLWMPLRDWKEVYFIVPVVFTMIPIALLSIYAPRLSSALGSEACLPNGDFVSAPTVELYARQDTCQHSATDSAGYLLTECRTSYG